ncbi:MAG TPA: FAD:protein FMN transferase [Acidimicrobiales bacterium]|nr:FAD:protein FMN transferase [Acidimicrobiales bacterium]
MSSKRNSAPGNLRSIRALGTTATVALTEPSNLDEAAELLCEELTAIDLACSRFREDSEIWRLNHAEGRRVGVSRLLFEALCVARDVAMYTDGVVDPTVGSAVQELGYDQTFSSIEAIAPGFERSPRPAPGWWRIELDEQSLSVRVPSGTVVDLGASGKALATDRAARRIAVACGCGALVSIGGDVSLSGHPPKPGWAIGIAVDSSAPLSTVDHVVSIAHGGLASSSTVVRSWRRGERRLHHIVDPRTGDVAFPYWSLVSAVGASCVMANAASTAAVVWGREAPRRLSAMGVPARLLGADGEEVFVCGWPSHDGVASARSIGAEG